MNLALSILNGSGNWQIYKKKKISIYRKRSKRPVWTYLDIACENNNIPLISFFLQHKLFMNYYLKEFPNKNNLFFARLNRICPQYINNDNNLKIMTDILHNSLAFTLNKANQQIEKIDGFSRQIELLLGYFGNKIEEIVEKDNENLTSNQTHLDDNPHYYLLEFSGLKVKNNKNFILRAFMHLDLKTVIIL